MHKCDHHACSMVATEPIAYPLCYAEGYFVALFCVEHALRALNEERGAKRATLSLNLTRIMEAGK